MVAAGNGSRLGAAVPKALVPVGGVPLVVRAVNRLAEAGVHHVVVVTAAAERAVFSDALGAVQVPLTFADGGVERQDSVARGLAALPGNLSEDAVVLVHDAARAFVPVAVVRSVVEAVLSGAEAAIPVVPVSDTIREITEEGSVVIDRSRLRGVQTPQGFRLGVIAEAHAELADRGVVVTDDAAAAEFLGHSVALVEGSREAFKVTDPFDLVLAEALAGRP